MQSGDARAGRQNSSSTASIRKWSTETALAEVEGVHGIDGSSSATACLWHSFSTDAFLLPHWEQHHILCIIALGDHLNL